MKFKTYYRDQMFLIPPSYKELLGESHQAMILAEFIDNLDLSSLLNSYKNDKGGSSAYHPAILLSVLIYGYMNNTFSSRVIAKKLREDLAFMFLAGNNTPDFRTLSRFRKEKSVYIKNLFVAVVLKAQQLGLINFSICSLDGTKIYANASKERNRNKKAITKNIKALLDQAAKLDEEEDNFYGEDNEDNENEELKTKAGRDKKRKEIEEKLKEEESQLAKLAEIKDLDNETKINLTDQDSKLMLMKRKDFANGYNVQVISENGIILTNYICNSPADTKTLQPTIESLKMAYAKSPQVILADKGYSSQSNYSYCKENDINAYIPPNIVGVNIDDYVYNEVDDTYRDKRGRIYKYKQHAEPKPGVEKITGQFKGDIEKQKLKHKEYRGIVYEYINRITKKRKYLRINPEWQVSIREQKEKLGTRQGEDIYKRRKYDVEGVFANIKKNMGFETFNLRGFDGVMAEWQLVVMAHNLRKIL